MSEHPTHFENSLDALLITKPNGQVLEANAAACEMFGYTEDVISHHGVLAEGVSFIGKPSTPSELARRVREVIDEA